MRKLEDIGKDLKQHISPNFATVRITTMQTGEQFLAEIKAISPEKLPAAVIVIDSGEFTDAGRVREPSATIVLIDRFVAASESKALSALRALDKLQELFPAPVTGIEDVYYSPVSFSAAPVDPAYTCFALELALKQAT